jgi:predicted PurR-regulated permease PerM
MTLRNLCTLASVALLLLVFLFVLSPSVFAQGPIPEAPAPSISVQTASSFVESPRVFEGSHKFWDRENKILFMTVAALNTADFAVTRSNLQNGGRELNPVVRFFGTSTPALALNFAGETAGFVSLSYFFHKTGHHKMERAVSYVNIGSSASAVSYGLAHR